MELVTSQSTHPNSSTPAREFPGTSAETQSAIASFAIESRTARSQLSARSTAQTCATGAENKKGAAAADELFHQSGRGIRASQPPRKIPTETEYHLSPKPEKLLVRQPTATNRATR